MLNNWNFENSYLELPDIFYSKTKVENFTKLELILKNKDFLSRFVFLFFELGFSHLVAGWGYFGLQIRILREKLCPEPAGNVWSLKT